MSRRARRPGVVKVIPSQVTKAPAWPSRAVTATSNSPLLSSEISGTTSTRAGPVATGGTDSLTSTTPLTPTSIG
jgi:hypothetical protein